MKTLMVRAVPAIALTALPLLALSPAAQAAAHQRPPAVSAPPTGTPAAEVTLSLPEAIEQIPTAAEKREGYQRTLYRHWNKGLDPADGCDTRREVILSEALAAPEVTAGCRLSGGMWVSPYDQVTVRDAAGLDVDHFVPLAEVHDSGGHTWDAGRRERYANDQLSPLTLIAVTAKSNRSKGDKDPAQWLPPAAGYHCQYAAQWTAAKLRWNLTADNTEHQALLDLAEACPTTIVAYEQAP